MVAKLWSCFLVMCLQLFVQHANTIECPPPYQVVSDWCYAPCGIRKTFEECQYQCSNISGIMVEPSSTEECGELVDWVYGYAYDKIWIGAQADYANNIGFKWLSSGELIDFTEWHDGEPNNWGEEDEDCVEKRIPIQGHQWDYAECEKGRPYICQIDSPTEVDCPEDYTFNADVSKCYKFVNAWHMFDKAIKTCEADNAILAEPRHEDENSALMDLALANDRNIIWIGAKQNKVFTWESSQTVVDFTGWSDSLEAHELNEECCVQIQFSRGAEKWNDVPCAGRRGCICQPE